jgi:hypothetical protein
MAVAAGSEFLLGGVPRVYPSCALGEKEKATLVGSTARVVFRTRAGDAATLRPRQVKRRAVLPYHLLYL